MPLKSIVKVSHLSNLSDARYCAGMGVEMLGFQAIPGHGHYIPREVYQDIRGWVSGPSIVAELYGVSSADQVVSVLDAYAPDFLELNLVEYLQYREVMSRPCLVTCTDPNDVRLIKEDPNVKYVIAGDGFICDDLRGATLPVLVSISSVEHLNDRLQEGCFRGFVLEAPGESRPGITSYDQLGDILEALDADA